ncbi:MAG: 4-alpha-glucanotransferase [Clostridia bacterium]|nr:4-alpha-glucanotransferase [Clostridia bacterium]
MRKAGVLLPVFSLMSEYGIGDFGASSKYFVDFIKGIGFKIWQILPITTIGAGNSPYSGVSAFAGNFLFIDLESLPERLLTDEEKASFKIYSPHKVKYDIVAENKRRALNIAFSRLNEDDLKEIEVFRAKNSFWIDDYALFMALSERFGNEWLNWEDGLKFRQKQALETAKKECADRVNYYYFEQYLFFKGWSSLKDYATACGIEIFGDMPIYVSFNSPDVWAHTDIFALDENLVPTEVAGVPPDYFAEEGQLWNNPLYDWEKMKASNYEWFVKRILHSLKLYDILRIDHFRGLCEYWALPKESKTAKVGEWKKGPGMELWDEVYKYVKSPQIVAEDLGIIDDKVVAYLDKTGFPGMRVLQFGFDGNRDNIHLPYNYAKNTFAYTATHDNDTSLGWIYALGAETRSGVLDFLEIDEHVWGIGGRDCITTKAMAKMVLSSSANVAIIPLQDLTGYGTDTRINTPGEPDGNWEYRITLSTLEDINTSYYSYMISKYGR